LRSPKFDSAFDLFSVHFVGSRLQQTNEWGISMSKDPALGAEIETETRKKYVGKVAEAQATALYAKNPTPSGGGTLGAIFLVAIAIAGLVVWGRWTVQNEDAPGAAEPAAAVSSAATSATIAQTAGQFVDATLAAAKQTCVSTDNCGVGASTTDAMARRATKGIFKLVYSPLQDDALHHGWQVFREATRTLDCDVAGAFGWTEEDDQTGNPPTSDVQVFC
jgi:hypothetical protein